MQVNASIHRTERTQVEIDPRDVVKQLREKYIRELPDLTKNGERAEYINQDGHWEVWIDTHGSGITYKLREATDQEKETMKAFDIVLKSCDIRASK